MPIKHLSWGMGGTRRLAGGVPAPTVVSATTNTAGTVVTVTFSKAMADPSGKHASFTVNDGAANAVTAVALNATTTKIDLTLTRAIDNGDTVTVAYSAGTVASSDTGVLASFGAQSVTNAVPIPVSYQEWSGYPDSPVLTASYPYQAIARRNNDLYTELYYSTQPLYVVPTRVIFSSATVYKRNYNGSTWAGEFSSELQFAYLIELNNDIYTDSSLTTVYSVKTTP